MFDKFMIGSMGVVILLLGVAPLLWYGIYVEWLLWHWFAVPLGAPPIGMLHVAGLSVMLSMFISTSRLATASQLNEVLRVHGKGYPPGRMTVQLLLPIPGAHLIGWLLQHWM